MTLFILVRWFIVFELAFSSWIACAGAQSSAGDSRLEEIQKELKLRRERREEALANAGIVCQPEYRSDEWYSAPQDIALDNSRIASCAQLYATLTRKEVMVSGKLANRRMSIPDRKMSVEQAIALIRRALVLEQVKEIMIGNDVVVWIRDPASDPKLL